MAKYNRCDQDRPRNVSQPGMNTEEWWVRQKRQAREELRLQRRLTEAQAELDHYRRMFRLICMAILGSTAMGVGGAFLCGPFGVNAGFILASVLGPMSAIALAITLVCWRLNRNENGELHRAVRRAQSELDDFITEAYTE